MAGMQVNPEYFLTKPFILNTDFLVRYDGRWVGKNVLDTSSAATIAQLGDPLTPGGAVLYAFLFEASEMVAAACAVGARYTIKDLFPDLDATPVPYPGGGNLLIRIVSDLAMGLILKRRARAVSDENELNAPYTEALAYLEALRRGERIFFMVPKVPEAGLPESASMLPRPGIDCPLITQEAVRYFGLIQPNRGNSWGQ